MTAASIVHTPSSGAARHLLPQGEKGSDCGLRAEDLGLDGASSAPSPSPLAGEGARRADEGASTNPNRLKPLARTMRRIPMEAERTMWRLLRDRRLVGFKFRRQVPLDYFIADFLCYSERLIIELDGSQHAESVVDAWRDEYLRSQGFRVLRFWNHDLLSDQDIVLQTIWNALHAPSSDATRHLLQQRGEGIPTEASLSPPSPVVANGARTADDEGAGL